MGGWRISLGRLVSHLVCIRGCSVLVDVEKIEVRGVFFCSSRTPPSLPFFSRSLVQDGADE